MMEKFPNNNPESEEPVIENSEPEAIRSFGPQQALSIIEEYYRRADEIGMGGDFGWQESLRHEAKQIADELPELIAALVDGVSGDADPKQKLRFIKAIKDAKHFNPSKVRDILNNLFMFPEKLEQIEKDAKNKQGLVGKIGSWWLNK